MIMEKTTAAKQETLIVNYDDRMTSQGSQYSAYRIWLDEDAWAGLILLASMEDRFSAEIVELERSHQM
jgi:fructose 1,6-bisphosphatase